MKNLLLLFLIMQSISFAQPVDEQLRQQALELHRNILTLDSHTDTPLWMARHTADLTTDRDIYEHPSLVHYDLMQAGGLDAVVFAVWTNQDELENADYPKVQKRAELLIDSVYSSIDAAGGRVQLCLTSGDIKKTEQDGKLSVILGLENGYPVAKDITRVQHYYDRGVRYITLCHVKNNDICDSSNDDKPLHNGLSVFGEEVVREMNRLGMMIDVSHISDKAFYDVIAISDAPVIASHSSVRSICDNPRNMTDDMIKRLAEQGGVIQIALFSDYLRNPPENPERDSVYAALRKKFETFDSMSKTDQEALRMEWNDAHDKYAVGLAPVSDLVDHIDYVKNLVGIDYVGIGSDFDGGGRLKDCADVSEIGNITIELVRRGYTKEEIEKIWGGNFLRVMREVEKRASK